MKASRRKPLHEALPRHGGVIDSPLWRLVLVIWKPRGRRARAALEEAVLAAAEAGELELAVTGIVVNCPITRAAEGVALRGAR